MLSRLLPSKLGGKKLLVQGSRPKAALLGTFRADGDAVLLATQSFWEGVDVPGRALRLVVLEKIPFSVPTDPVMVARGRELAIMHRADGSDGVLVMVKDDSGGANRKLSGGYRLLGVESQRVDGDDDVETMLGTIAIGNDCITCGNYILARGDNGYAIEPSLAGDCAVGSMDYATLELPVTSRPWWFGW